MSDKIKTGWKDPRSRIIPHPKDDSGCQGYFYYYDIPFKFSIRGQKRSADYGFRGEITLCDPSTLNPIRTSSGGHKKTAKVQIRTDSAERKEIKQHIASKAEKLYQKYHTTIKKLLRNPSLSQEAYPLMLYRVYGEEFVRTHCGKNPAYKAQQKRRLEQICGKYDYTPISAITQAQIRNAYKSCGKSGREKILLLNRFLNYCRDLKAYHGDNPVSTFIEKELPAKQKGDSIVLAKRAAKQKFFDAATKENSLQLIMDSLEDGRNMGVLLIGDGGLSAAQAVMLCWKDILFDADDDRYVTISISQPDSAGYTHDYSHPVFPYAGFLLHRRFDLLVKKYGEDKVLDLPVVSQARDPRKAVNASLLASHCKRHIRMAFEKDTEKKRSPFLPDNASVKFLQLDYENRLANICGMSADPSAVLYMCCRSLSNDVTADSYRGFSSVDGQYYLYGLLCRDQRFEHLFSETEPDLPDYSLKETKDGITIQICGKPGNLASATLRLKSAGLTTDDLLLAKAKYGVEITSVKRNKSLGC